MTYKPELTSNFPLSGPGCVVTVTICFVVPLLTNPVPISLNL